MGNERQSNKNFTTTSIQRHLDVSSERLPDSHLPDDQLGMGSPEWHKRQSKIYDLRFYLEYVLLTLKYFLFAEYMKEKIKLEEDRVKYSPERHDEVSDFFNNLTKIILEKQKTAALLNKEQMEFLHALKSRVDGVITTLKGYVSVLGKEIQILKDKIDQTQKDIMELKSNYGMLVGRALLEGAKKFQDNPLILNAKGLNEQNNIVIDKHGFSDLSKKISEAILNKNYDGDLEKVIMNESESYLRSKFPVLAAQSPLLADVKEQLSTEVKNIIVHHKDYNEIQNLVFELDSKKLDLSFDQKALSICEGRMKILQNKIAIGEKLSEAIGETLATERGNPDFIKNLSEKCDDAMQSARNEINSLMVPQNLPEIFNDPFADPFAEIESDQKEITSKEHSVNAPRL